jgi:hypothetical protein
MRLRGLRQRCSYLKLLTSRGIVPSALTFVPSVDHLMKRLLALRARHVRCVATGYTPDGLWQCGEHTFELTMNPQPSPETGEYDVSTRKLTVTSVTVRVNALGAGMVTAALGLSSPLACPPLLLSVMSQCYHTALSRTMMRRHVAPPCAASPCVCALRLQQSERLIAAAYALHVYVLPYCTGHVEVLHRGECIACSYSLQVGMQACRSTD